MANDYSFGPQSLKVRDELHHKLVLIVDELIKHMDISLICGIRSKEDQNREFEEGDSHLRWPDGKHNVLEEGQLSRAVDMRPYPFDPDDYNRILYMSGLAKGIGEGMGIRVIVGADWNANGILTDQKFNDLFHLELHSSEE